MIASHVGRWAQAQQEQLQLCTRIDQLAERLPLHDVDVLGLLGSQIAAILDRVQLFEEGQLFPLLEAMSPQMRPLLTTFRNHHSRDRITANAIAERLAQPSPDAGGLKDLKRELESFSERLRRHVQFEEAIATALFASGRVSEKRAVQ